MYTPVRPTAPRCQDIGHEYRDYRPARRSSGKLGILVQSVHGKVEPGAPDIRVASVG
jgi:hypothetical protein